MIRFDPVKHVSRNRLDLAIGRNAHLRAKANAYAQNAQDAQKRVNVYALLAIMSWVILITYIALGK